MRPIDDTCPVDDSDLIWEMPMGGDGVCLMAGTMMPFAAATCLKYPPPPELR